MVNINNAEPSKNPSKSTAQTISRNTAVGVVSGWTATFLSTALAIQWHTTGMLLEQHLRMVPALALLVLPILLVMMAFTIVCCWC